MFQSGLSYRLKMTDTPTTRYWVHVITLDHAQKSMTGGFIQIDGDKSELSREDQVLFYSPRTRFRKGKSLQEFTALGVVQDTENQGDGGKGGQATRPRLPMKFLSTKNIPIKPMLGQLSFLPDQERWEIPFAKGLFEINEADFLVISQAMGLEEPVTKL